MNHAQALKLIVSRWDDALEGHGSVTLLDGDWGAGKTYFWKEIVEKKYKDYKIKDDKIPVVTVSCFGVSSLGDLKKSVFTKYLMNNKKDVFRFDAIFQVAKWIANKTSQGFNADLGLNVDFFETIPPKLVICFDDLERSSSSLSMEDLLGFISGIAEQKQAAVFVIANGGRFEGDNKEVFDAYKEKVFSKCVKLTQDMDVVYDTFVDKLKLGERLPAFTKQSVLEMFQNAGVQNLRTLWRTLRNIDSLLKHDISISNTEWIPTIAALTLEYTRNPVLDSRVKASQDLLLHRHIVENPGEKYSSQIEFLTQYFKKDGPFSGYKYSHDLICLVFEMDYNFEQLKRALNPPDSEFQKFVSKYNGSNCLSCNSSEMLNDIDEVTKLLENTNPTHPIASGLFVEVCVVRDGVLQLLGESGTGLNYEEILEGLQNNGKLVLELGPVIRYDDALYKKLNEKIASYSERKSELEFRDQIKSLFKVGDWKLDHLKFLDHKGFEETFDAIFSEDILQHFTDHITRWPKNSVWLIEKWIYKIKKDDIERSSEKIDRLKVYLKNLKSSEEIMVEKRAEYFLDRLEGIVQHVTQR